MKTPLLPQWKSRVFPVLCAGLLAASGHAAVLVNDNFTNSSGTNVGTVSNTQATGVGTYSTILGSNGMSVTTVSGFGSGNVLSFGNNTNNYYRAFNGDVSLTLAGLLDNQTLRLEFDVYFGGTFSSTDNFSFGFVNFSTPNAILYANVDLQSPGGSVGSEFKYRTGAGSYNMGELGTNIGSSFTAHASTATSYTFRLDVTKLVDGSYSIGYYRDDVLLGSAAAPSSLATANTAITGIAFRHGTGPGVTTYIDNVSVVTVPEPSVALLALGGLGLVFLRRRVAR